MISKRVWQSRGSIDEGASSGGDDLASAIKDEPMNDAALDFRQEQTDAVENLPGAEEQTDTTKKLPDTNEQTDITEKLPGVREGLKTSWLREWSYKM